MTRLRKACFFSLGAAAVLLLPSATAQQPHRRPAAPAAHQGPRGPEPTGPTVVIDTSMGRLTCRLYTKEAPQMSENFLGLATGAKDWHDGATGETVHGKPFYDGIAITASGDAISAGDRLGAGRGLGGPRWPEEHSGLAFDRPGRLAMVARNGETSSSVFLVTAHANDERAKEAEIFGQCDDASSAVVLTIAHTLLVSDNHPEQAVGIYHIAVVQPGEPLPPVAAAIPPEQFTPQVGPPPVPVVAAPEPSGPTAIIQTTMGPLTCRLFGKETPVAVENFIGLAEGTKPWKNPVTHATVHGKPFYNGLTFARVLPDFMVQNADMPGGVHGGDIGIKFDNEVVPGLNFDRPGRLAYANAGPGTNESEFFITEHPVSRLNGNYTIFGQCDDASVKVVEAIARVPRDEHNTPLKPVVIRSVKIVR